MRHVSAHELQRNIGEVQDIALTEPVAITHHGRERLVLLSVDEYNRLKKRDRQSSATKDLPEWIIDKIANAEMDDRLSSLDRLMDE
jgi:prevent-host-death family protein